MNKFIKWVLLGGLGLVGLIIIALLIIPFFVDVNQYKPLMETRVAQATGRSFRIGGDLSLSLFPWAGVTFSDLEMGNPEGFEEDSFLSIDAFDVRVKLLPLLSRHIEVQKFVVDGPRVTLIQHKSGKVNWDFAGARPASPQTPPEKPLQAPGAPSGGSVDDSVAGLPIEKLAVGDFSISRGTLVYVDQAAGTRHEVDDFNLTLHDLSFDRPIRFDMSALVNRQPVAANGKLGPVGKDPGKGIVPVDVELNALEHLSATIAGTIANAAEKPRLDLALEIRPFSLKRLLSQIPDAPPIQTADPKALEKVSLKAQVDADTSAVAVTRGDLALDDTQVTFSLNASHFERPNIRFDLDLDRIDLNRYLPPEAQTQEKPAATSTGQDQPGSGKSEGKSAAAKTGKKPVDYGPLRRLILDGQFKAGTIVVHKSTVNDVQLAVTGKDGRFNVDPFSLNAYQGIVAGKAALNVAGKVPASGIDLRVADLQVAPLVADQTGKDLIEGTTHADIKLKMVGDTPDQIKRTLNGTGELRFNDGAIVGFDLAAMARNVKAAFGLAPSSGKRPRTDFTELLVPFTIRDGVVDTRQTRLKSPFLRVLAAGKADLVKENLDFRIEPTAVGTIKGQGDEAERSGVMVPVLVSGSFAQPTFKPDLKAIAEQQIEKQVFENEEVKKIFEKEELKPLKEPVKNLLKGFIK